MVDSSLLYSVEQADRFLSLKGVKHGKLIITGSGEGHGIGHRGESAIIFG